MVAANDVWDAILRAAQSLESSAVVLGLSAKMAITEEARRAGVAWERLPEPKPRVTLEIFTPTGQEEIFFLGPHAPHLTPKEIDLLHSLWLRFSDELAPEELHHHDIVHFALNELKQELAEGKDGEVRERLRKHLEEIKIPPCAGPLKTLKEVFYAWHLRAARFHRRWRGWIQACLSSVGRKT